jgi:hypothetical protein
LFSHEIVVRINRAHFILHLQLKLGLNLIKELGIFTIDSLPKFYHSLLLADLADNFSWRKVANGLSDHPNLVVF